MFGVNVAIVCHERVPFILGVPKEFWNSSRFKICKFVHLRDWDFVCQTHE
jgi:hypothetical protein